MKTIIKLLLISSPLIILNSCLITYNKSGREYTNPSYQKLSYDTVSVLYFTHLQPNISSLATTEVENILKECNNIITINAYKTEEYLQRAGLFVLPQRFTKVLADSLKNILPSRYLLRGNVNQWENPILGDIPEGPKINITYELWDLRKGELVQLLLHF